MAYTHPATPPFEGATVYVEVDGQAVLVCFGDCDEECRDKHIQDHPEHAEEIRRQVSRAGLTPQ